MTLSWRNVHPTTLTLPGSTNPTALVKTNFVQRFYELVSSTDTQIFRVAQHYELATHHAMPVNFTDTRTSES